MSNHSNTTCTGISSSFGNDRPKRDYLALLYEQRERERENALTAFGEDDSAHERQGQFGNDTAGRLGMTAATLPEQRSFRSHGDAIAACESHYNTGHLESAWNDSANSGSRYSVPSATFLTQSGTALSSSMLPTSAHSLANVPQYEIKPMAQPYQAASLPLPSRSPSQDSRICWTLPSPPTVCLQTQIQQVVVHQEMQELVLQQRNHQLQHHQKQGLLTLMMLQAEIDNEPSLFRPNLALASTSGKTTEPPCRPVQKAGIAPGPSQHGLSNRSSWNTTNTAETDGSVEPSCQVDPRRPTTAAAPSSQSSPIPDPAVAINS